MEKNSRRKQSLDISEFPDLLMLCDAFQSYTFNFEFIRNSQ